MTEHAQQHEMPLFEAAAKKLAKRTDPSTSREAAASAVASGVVHRCEQLAIKMIGKYPGKTANELEMLAGVEKRVIGKRLSALREKKRIRNGETTRKCAVSGKRCQTWYLTGERSS